MGFAAPSPHAEEMESHSGVRIGVHARDPRRGELDIHAEFLVELTGERVRWRFALLDLTAGKFPIAAIDFAGRALRQQKAAVRPQEHACGDVYDARHFRRRGRTSPFALPA